MRHFVLYRYYGILVLKSQLLRRKGIVTIRSNIKGREPQLPTTLSSYVTKDNFMIIEFSENDKKNFNKASTIQDAYAEWKYSLNHRFYISKYNDYFFYLLSVAFTFSLQLK